MPSKYTSEKKTVGELLSMTSPPIVVPEWQRNYSWTPSHVETFWNDIKSFRELYPGDNVTDQEYFLGSIVLVDTGRSHLLLDGQQRLATVTILLSVIRDALDRFNHDAAQRTSQKYITDIDDATGTKVFKITLNRYDQSFFRQEVQEFPVPGAVAPDPNISSHRLIRQARAFFQSTIASLYNAMGGGRTAFEWVLGLQGVLTNHISVVAVTSTDEDNAANVFETLNDRGIGLSTPDLLRNLILRRADEGDRDEIIECWRVILEIDDHAAVDDFLRHYWLSKEGDVKTRSLYREIKSYVIRNNTNSLTLSRELRDASLTYRDIVTAKDDDPGVRELLGVVHELGAKAMLPVVLSSYAACDLAGRLRILKAVVALFVRYSVIGNRENNKLETVAYRSAKTLRLDRDVEGVIGRFKDLAPNDGEFEEQFATAQLGRRASARYILRALETARRRTEELDVATPDRVHVEHIYPQNPPAGGRWPDHLSLIERLGNLTLLSRRMNEGIGNLTFDAKKPSYAQSEIMITKELADVPRWDRQAIDDRQRKMAESAVAIWSFPD